MGGKGLVEEFVRLAKMPSPSGKELSVARCIIERLRSMGLSPYLDNANIGTACESGNVVAKIKGSGPTLMFLAHIDTVEAGDREIKPLVNGDIIRSDGKTILGADNKGGVVSLLDAMERTVKLQDRPNVICAFTVCEETDMLGVKAMELGGKIDYAFDIDGGGPPGTFTTKALGVSRFSARFTGKEAHAARAPERGRHAIRAASLFVTRLKMGKAADGSTLNVGMVHGGRRTNVIPAETEVVGEVRAYSDAGIKKRLSEVAAASKSSCADTGCRYKLSIVPEVPPFSRSASKGILRLAKNASIRAGLDFAPLTLDACIQANVIADRAKFPVLGLCRGGHEAHSNSEWTRAGYLSDASNLIFEIIKGAKE